MADLTDIIQLKSFMLSKLEAAQKKRPKLPNLAWIEHERVEMIKAVRQQVEERGCAFGPEHEEAVLRGERRATGHTDYSSKWALYCAEAVLYANKALTPRELEVLRSLANGFDYRDTAESLAISIHTVRFHAQNLRVKLLAGDSNAAAVAEAFRRGLLT